MSLMASIWTRLQKQLFEQPVQRQKKALLQPKGALVSKLLIQHQIRLMAHQSAEARWNEVCDVLTVNLLSKPKTLLHGEEIGWFCEKISTKTKGSGLNLDF